VLSFPQKSETEKFEIRFTVYAEIGTLDYELLTYLKKNKLMSRDRLKEMAMAALTAYYLPPARVNSSAVTKEQRHLAVLEGIQRLRLQEQYFRELAGLCGELNVKELDSSSSSYLDDNNDPALEAIEADKKEAQFDPEEMF
jgi:hypothetical protein